MSLVMMWSYACGWWDGGVGEIVFFHLLGVAIEGIQSCFYSRREGSKSEECAIYPMNEDAKKGCEVA